MQIISGFRPGDLTTNQLLYLVNEIHQAFENPKSLGSCSIPRHFQSL